MFCNNKLRDASKEASLNLMSMESLDLMGVRRGIGRGCFRGRLLRRGL